KQLSVSNKICIFGVSHLNPTVVCNVVRKYARDPNASVTAVRQVNGVVRFDVTHGSSNQQVIHKLYQAKSRVNWLVRQDLPLTERTHTTKLYKSKSKSSNLGNSCITIGG
ncbi:hypothetical protein MXB_328, partial [Myxobolus squamalis]